MPGTTAGNNVIMFNFKVVYKDFPPLRRLTHRASLLARATEILLIAIVYFLLAWLCLGLQFAESNATPVWAPSGFAFAMVLLRGYRASAAILLGAFGANLVVFLSHHPAHTATAIWLPLVIGIGNTAEALMGYYLVQTGVQLNNVSDIVKSTNGIFRLCLVAVIMSAVSAEVGVTATFVAGMINSSQYFYVWLTWWLGDLSGILLLTPLLLLLSDAGKHFNAFKNIALKKKLEVVFVLALVVLSSGIIFDDWLLQLVVFRWAYWIIPFLVWCAVRFNRLETIIALVLCSVVAVWGTIKRHGPFANASLNDSLIIVEAFISIVVVTKMALNASVIERRETEAKLRQLAAELDIRVKKRTEELAKATETLKEKNSELANKNEELTAFSYMASHDLQEPLRKIQMFSKMISESELPVLSEKGADLLSRMDNAARRMQQLILDLLTYSHTGFSEEAFVKTDLNGLLAEVRDEMKEKIETTMTTIEVVRLPVLSVIPFQFRQLFTNLITNAIKFARPGIPPHIRISGAPVSQPPAGTTNSVQPFYKITVQDNGLGFPPEYNEQVFGLFQRLHPSMKYQGSGLGLSICKRIVENHRGVIIASGNPNNGAVFDIYLPFV
jgi:signal transduction histidine kinase